MLPTFKDGDEVLVDKIMKNTNIDINDIVVFNHPLKKNISLIKRVSKISNGTYFVEGDNSDHLQSEDSHNFGNINFCDLVAYKKGV